MRVPEHGELRDCWACWHRPEPHLPVYRMMPPSRDSCGEGKPAGSTPLTSRGHPLTSREHRLAGAAPVSSSPAYQCLPDPGMGTEPREMETQVWLCVQIGGQDSPEGPWGSHASSPGMCWLGQGHLPQEGDLPGFPWGPAPCTQVGRGCRVSHVLQRLVRDSQPAMGNSVSGGPSEGRTAPLGCWLRPRRWCPVTDLGAFDALRPGMLWETEVQVGRVLTPSSMSRPGPHL